MLSFLKGVLKGLLYVLFFPIGLIGIALYAVFGVGVFIYRFIKLIYLFFTGRNLKNELKEDEEVRKILEANKPEEESKEEIAMTLYPSDSEIYKTDNYISPNFEEKKQEETEDNSIEVNKEDEING